MSEQDKKKLVPALRFPRFRDEEEWEKTTIGKSVNFLDGKRKPIKESDRAAMQGEYPYYGASGIIDYVNSFIFDEDLILLGEDGENIVSRNLPLVFKVTGKCWINNHAHVLIPQKPHHLDFLVQYMESLSYIKYNSGGAQPKLNQAVCKTIPLILPKPLEQQKIADCLSSIDELVTAQNQKLEALKAHKKGLMQQLFPAEGETAPKLRFPEFQGEWKYYEIKDFAKITTGNKDTQNKVEDGKYPFFVRSQTVERINSYSHDGEAILTSGDGVGVGKNFHYIVGKFDFHQRVYCIFDFNEISLGKFFYQYFSKNFYKRVMQLNAKNSVDSVRMAMISDMPIRLPSIEEQQKIADCLASIDELITAQNQKIEALKAHKKGLLQQLFPAVDDVSI